MDSELALITAEVGSVPMLDLHGRVARELPAALDEFLQSSWMRHESAVRIVHGKGEGALRGALLRELRAHELVADFRVHENGGSTAVALVPR